MATKDAVLDRAVDLARSVALELAEQPSDVGEHLGTTLEGERLVAHRFECLARGYRGWQWTVTVARVPRGRVATVCEAVLLPGPDAILAKEWLPWSERLRPGDIGPGDVLPFKADDPRLVPGWTPSGDPELDEVAIDELALARERVLSQTGRDEAAMRWYRGSQGPTSAGALSATAACSSCGFLVLLQGSLGQVFGVCANEWSPEDGRVVSLDHGCGAHSQTDVEPEPTAWPEPDPLVDELRLDVVPARTAGARDAGTADAGATEVAADGPVGEVPAGQVPAGGVSAGEVPAGDVPAGEVPTDVPAADVPAVQGLLPDGQAADSAAPDVPVAEVPVADVAATDVLAPDVAVSDVLAPDVAVSDVLAPDVAVSDVLAPDVAVTDVPAADKLATDEPAAVLAPTDEVPDTTGLADAPATADPDDPTRSSTGLQDGSESGQ